jgi:hypothetical protein
VRSAVVSLAKAGQSSAPPALAFARASAKVGGPSGRSPSRRAPALADAARTRLTRPARLNGPRCGDVVAATW